MRKIIGIALTCFLIITLSGCGFAADLLNMGFGGYSGQAQVIKTNWGINIPSGSREIYFNMLESVFGDGPRYTVLEYNDNTELENLFVWTKADEESVTEAEGYIEDLNYSLKEIGQSDETVPEELIPDFSGLRMYADEKDGGYDRIFVFYDESKSRLYIVEHF